MALDSHEQTCLERGWTALGLLAILIARLTGAGLFTQRLKRRVYQLLRAGEALARRLLILAALDEDLPAQPDRQRSQQTLAQEGVHDRPSPRASNFKLEEPFAAFHPLSDIPFEPQTGHEPTLPDPDTPADASHALARLKTLQALLIDPSRQITRMARWLAAHVQLDIGRRSPLCQRGLSSSNDADIPQHLPDADLFARRALDRAANPSPG